MVEKSFPELAIQGKKGDSLVLDYEKMRHTDWDEPVFYNDIEKAEVTESAMGKPLLRFHQEGGKPKRSITISKVGSQEEVVGAFNHYYARYMTAVEYLKEKEGKDDGGGEDEEE